MTDFDLMECFFTLLDIISSNVFSIDASEYLTINKNGFSTVIRLANMSMTIPIKMAPMITSGINPAPHKIPEAAAQNRKTKSMGSLMGVLNRTMESAPTIPREITILVDMPMMIKAVAIVMMMREILKLCEYITPEKVFL